MAREKAAELLTVRQVLEELGGISRELPESAPALPNTPNTPAS